jgi:hypothetical protein
MPNISQKKGTKTVTASGIDRYGAELLEAFNTVSVPLHDVVAEYLKQIERRVDKARHAAGLQKKKAHPKLAEAETFWNYVIKPLIIKEKIDSKGEAVTFRPDAAYEEAAIAALGSGGLDVVIYLRLQQSYVSDFQPDTRVTMSCLEVLKYWGGKAKVAEALGLDIRFIIGDESSALPVDDLLGFTRHAYQESGEIMAAYLRQAGIAHLVIVRPIKDSLRVPLKDAGKRRQILTEFKACHNRLRSNIAQSMRGGYETWETHRASLFTHILTPKGRGVLAVPSPLAPGELYHLSAGTIDYLAQAVAGFNSLLALRQSVREAVRLGGLSGHPEFGHPSRLTLHMGITRASHRPSLLPVGRRWKGSMVMPAYGLPIYDKAGRCHGLLHHTQLQSDEPFQLVRIGSKSSCLIKQN